MKKLHQIIALAAGQRSQSEKALAEVYKRVQKPPLFDGLVRTYRPKVDDEHELPPEQKNIQANWQDCITRAVNSWTKLINILATQDTANCKARGTIRVDGAVLVADVPVTHLLFLEKQIVDVRTFVSKLPVLDPSESWQEDANKNCYVTKPQRKIRTRKVTKPLVLYDATEKHPAQTQTIEEDIVVGEWETVLMSGRIPAAMKDVMLTRIDKLIDGIKMAREEANQTPADFCDIARPLFDYIGTAKLPQQAAP
jgi:hypothetical protein